MAFNRAVVADRLADCGAAAGAPRPGADGFIAWIEALKAEIGIPRTLAEAGVGRAHLDRLVAVAVNDVCHGNNPRPVREADFRAMFEEAGLGA
jgi:alcohol dehydrogenase class IV